MCTDSSVLLSFQNSDCRQHRIFSLEYIQYYYNTTKLLKILFELITFFYQIVYNTLPLCYTLIVCLRYGITSVIFRRFSKEISWLPVFSLQEGRPPWLTHNRREMEINLIIVSIRHCLDPIQSVCYVLYYKGAKWDIYQFLKQK